VAWYGWYEVHVFAGRGADAVVVAGTAVQHRISGTLDTAGAPIIAVVFVVLLVVALLNHRSRDSGRVNAG
jgi:hypothetical protein